MEISGYKIIKCLGEGGMSTVYLAAQESVNRYVALKVMLPELMEDPDNSRRFLREARIAARFRHPNIISIYDVSLENGQPYITMEYVPGGKLDTERIKSMSLTEKLNVVVQCADAISFLHSQNYIHRDIKPGNILFREDDSIVLTDFGVAHDARASTKITRTGFIIGTPHYMSPEQARGIELDARADVYSLGVLLFRLLAGRVPFSADHPVTVCTMHMNAPIPDLPDDVARFDPVVKKAMAKDRDDRYRSANEFIDALIAVTGSDTAKLLKRSVTGTALEEVNPGDETTPSQLQKSYAGQIKERVEPTISEPKTVMQATPRRSSATKKRKKRDRSPSKPRRRFGTVLGIGLAGLGGVLAGLLYLFGPQLWEQINEITGQTDSFASQFERAERLIEDGTRSSLVQANNQYASILARDPQNERAREGRETVEGMLAELNAPPEPPAADPQPAEEPAPEVRDEKQETIERLLALGAEYARNPVGLEQGISPSQPYRDILRIDPENQPAVLGLISLAEGMMTLTEFSLDRNDPETARWLLEEIAKTGVTNTERLNSLQNRYAEMTAPPEPEPVPEPEPPPVNQEVVDALKRGFEYLGDDQLSRPADANAIDEFNKVLAIDGSNAEALSGLKMVAERYVVLARSAIDRGNRSTAERYWDQAESLNPELPGLAELRAQIDQMGPGSPSQTVGSSGSAPPSEFSAYRFGNLGITGNESAADLFRLAETELNKGNDLRAYGLYLETLKRDPNHRGAARRLNRGAGVYLRYAGRDISEGNLGSAYSNLEIALTLDADHPRAESTRRSYLSARQEKYSSGSDSAPQSDDLVRNMRVNLYLKNAQTSHRQFTADTSNQSAATRAREQYQEVLALDENQAEARAGLAALCDEMIDASVQALQQGRRDDAMWFYTNAYSINPQNPRLTALEAQLR